MNSKLFFQNFKLCKILTFLFLFGILSIVDLNAQMDKSFTNTLGSYDVTLTKSFVSNMVTGYNNGLNLGRNFQNENDLFSYLGVSRPTYITLSEYVVANPNHVIAVTVENLIRNSTSLANFRYQLTQISTNNLSYQDKTFLAMVDYAAQFLNDTSISYVDSPGGNRIMKVVDMNMWLSWKCNMDILASMSLGALTGSAVGPGGTLIGGLAGGWLAYSQSPNCN